MNKILFSCMLTILASSSMAAASGGGAGSSSGGGAAGGAGGGRESTSGIMLKEADYRGVGGSRQRKLGEIADAGSSEMLTSSHDRRWEKYREDEGRKRRHARNRREDETRMAWDVYRPERYESTGESVSIPLEEAKFRGVRGSRPPRAGETIHASAKDRSPWERRYSTDEEARRPETDESAGELISIPLEEAEFRGVGGSRPPRAGERAHASAKDKSPRWRY